MTFRVFALTLISLAFLLVLAPSAQALPQDCDVKCTPSTPSYIVCACPFAYEVSTCGTWFFDCNMLLTETTGLPGTILDELGVVRYGA